MQIRQANVNFSQQQLLQQSTRQVTAVIEDGRLQPQSGPADAQRPAGTVTALAFNARSELRQQAILSVATVTGSGKLAEPDQLATSDYRLLLLKAMVETLTGKKIELAQIDTKTPESVSAATAVNRSPAGGQSQRTTVTLDLLQEYEYSEVTIAAALTDDKGNSLSISLSVVMERRYQQQTLGVLVEQGYIKDPLVINFAGDTLRLSEQRSGFDLDGDGSLEQIARFASDSAYIALDRNGDGIVNDGSELFGPRTGAGFAEFAVLDEDGNGFVDSGDSLFDQLVAFQPGMGIIGNLSTMGVQALFTGSVDSPFRITDSNNRSLADVRATGFYLDANNLPGSLQQIDLNV